ncbi:coiled-coil domain-containing protein 97-like isoform X3 [Anneissia japonica]|nr:coiled-coil domain-containing protein 97-like isoform X3 [Anneissia japonica]XP_033115786.1 coiled-coil domain-containing protein 97-like isoform X3 [Anneissia japonica]XP_033115787.1 coiled-coil domain-containing protein 97-like isoform X3 [Anneissia japonica]
MLENIANSNARISSQQKDEIDLTLEQKVVILRELFEKKPAVFAERFHMYLAEEDLIAFENNKLYEVDFYLKEARKRLASNNSDVVVKNRRYEALRKLEREGVYFGDEAMNERAPYMYNYYIGQYQSQAEKERPYDNTDLKFSTILIDFMHRQDREALFKSQQEDEECMEEEEEEEEDEDDDEEEKEDEVHSSPDPKESGSKVTITDEEKHLLREEFMSHMRERFLSGKDEDFDYTSVDFNREYDSVETRTQDEQEKYFDDD